MPEVPWDGLWTLSFGLSRWGGPGPVMPEVPWDGLWTLSFGLSRCRGHGIVGAVALSRQLHPPLQARDHRTRFWRCLGTASGHFLLGSHSVVVTASAAPSPCRPVTTGHDSGGALGRPLDTLFWALTVSWSWHRGRRGPQQAAPSPLLQARDHRTRFWRRLETASGHFLLGTFSRCRGHGLGRQLSSSVCGKVYSKWRRWSPVTNSFTKKWRWERPASLSSGAIAATDRRGHPRVPARVRACVGLLAWPSSKNKSPARSLPTCWASATSQRGAYKLASFINDSAAHFHILLITLSCAASCLKKRRETHTYMWQLTHPPFHPSQTPILGLHTTWVSGPPATLACSVHSSITAVAVSGTS